MADKFTEADLEKAVDDLATMRFFPREQRSAVMLQLARMCPHREALRWLVAKCVARVPYWPGMSELRGILCSKYDAADGVDAYCSLPGFTAEEAEMKFIEGQHERLKLEEGLGGGQLLQLVAAEQKPAALLESRDMSQPRKVTTIAGGPKPPNAMELAILREEAESSNPTIAEAAKAVLARHGAEP